ncbi:MAG: DegT/DnrJ/EryC1/StrS family aminotransferase [Candidatus Zixiibacteriota bacterium]
MTNDLIEKKSKFDPIPITRPVFDDDDIRAVSEVLKSGWVVQGSRVKEFERLFCEFTGGAHAIAANSCTSALHLSLVAAGIGPGDEVLLPSFTFIATANAVEYTGARPVFVDIDPATYNIDANKIEACLKNHKSAGLTRPKAIIPVSLFGLSADMVAVNRLAEQYGLIVIEDAACSLGAFRDGRHAGTEALTGNFSFHPRKALSTGEGGMVLTNDDKIADRIRKLRDHGASKTDLERHLSDGGSLLPEYNLLGYNYRLTDIQGALGVNQMNKVETVLRGRQEAARRYYQLLETVPELVPPVVPEKYHHAYQSFVCLYRPDNIEKPSRKEIDRLNRDRNRLMAHLESRGISVRQGTHAVHTLGYYQNKYGLADFDFPFAYLADRLTITLPLYYDLSEPEQKRVVSTIREYLDGKI